MSAAQHLDTNIQGDNLLSENETAPAAENKDGEAALHKGNVNTA